VLFRSNPSTPAVPERTTQVSTLLASEVEGVVVAMPAHNEEPNIGPVANDFMTTLEKQGIPHKIVIVNDGSADGTGAIIDALAREHPEQIHAFHHETNGGYGATIRTSLGNAMKLARASGYRWVLTCDSDGQFKADDLPGLLEHARTNRADMVLGYRGERADPLKRKIMGFLWTMLCVVLLRVRTRDVDCAYKLIDIRYLEQLNLRGQMAVISPELIAKTAAAGARILQFRVGHYPRQEGEQTGSKLSVVFKSLLGVFGVYVDLVRSGHRLSRLRRLVVPRDRGAYVVTLVAMVLAVGAYLWYSHKGVILAYPDAVSHLLISRRVVDSTTPGLAQLGGVWLPLPHLLALFGIWDTSLYHSGLAGSAVSMIAFVVAARFIYKLGAEYSRQPLMGLVMAGLFMANLNVLYLQATPMTEMLLIACMVASVYYLMRWSRQPEEWRFLMASSVAALLACATRYEGWVLLGGLALAVWYVSWRRSQGRGWRRATLAYFGFVAGMMIPGWMAWNWVILGSPLNFWNGAYAKPSLWVASGEQAVGHLTVAARTYWIAVVDNAGFSLVLLALFGLYYFLWQSRLRPETVAPLVLLTLAPFFVLALYGGQRPLHVPQISGDLYNVRFGLVMTPAVAFFVGYLVTELAGQIRRGLAVRLLPHVAVIGLAVAIAVFGGVPSTLAEGMAFRAAPTEQADAAASKWLRAHYDGGLVLMESFGNESVTFASQIPTDRIVYEGSYRQWQPALTDPAGHDVRWVYERRTPGSEDDVYRSLNGTNRLAGYAMVYQDHGRVIYRRGAASSVVASGTPTTTVQSTPAARVPSPPHQSVPRQTPVHTGIASWYHGPAGACGYSELPQGSSIRVTSSKAKISIVCRVVKEGPGQSGRIVNLTAPDFARLGPLALGLLAVEVSRLP
jgi:glycosyltransferase involved in cell wall biosynthesis